MYVNRQGHQVARHQVDKARVADQLRKLMAQVDLDVLGVEALSGPIPRRLQEDEEIDNCLKASGPGNDVNVSKRLDDRRRQVIAAVAVAILHVS